jgi:hypothetical protein
VLAEFADSRRLFVPLSATRLTPHAFPDGHSACCKKAVIARVLAQRTRKEAIRRYSRRIKRGIAIHSSADFNN